MKKKIAVAALCLMLFLTGCQFGNSHIIVSGTIGSKQVFKIGKLSCDVKEVKVYLANYQNIYGVAYGIDLWEHDFGEDSLEQYVRNVTLEELTRIYGMDLLAESHEMTLTEEERGKVKNAAGEYFASLSEAECEYLEVSESDIAVYYEHYALAQKIYHFLTESVNEEVSDDEARVMELQQIYVTTSAKADEVSERLRNKEDFAAIANNYNELPTIQVTVSRDDLPTEVEEVAFQLDNNEISGRIGTENGYYFIKCLNKYNEELTEANKSNIVEKREKEAFDDAYNALMSTLSSSFNQDVWEAVELDLGGEIKTDSFFDVFDRHCGEI